MSRLVYEQRVADPRRDLARRRVHRSLELQRDRGGEVALIPVLRDVEAHTRGGSGSPAVRRAARREWVRRSRITLALELAV